MWSQTNTAWEPPKKLRWNQRRGGQWGDSREQAPRDITQGSLGTALTFYMEEEGGLWAVSQVQEQGKIKFRKYFFQWKHIDDQCMLFWLDDTNLSIRGQWFCKDLAVFSTLTAPTWTEGDTSPFRTSGKSRTRTHLSRSSTCWEPPRFCSFLSFWWIKLGNIAGVGVCLYVCV